MDIFLILGDQLFPAKHLTPFKRMSVFMAEDMHLCDRYKFHKHKLVFFLSAMRHYRKSLEEKGFKVNYHTLEEGHTTNYIDKLEKFLTKNDTTQLHSFEVENHFMVKLIQDYCNSAKIEWIQHPSPMFSCSKEKFNSLSLIHI